jgi:hypothetical protein
MVRMASVDVGYPKFGAQTLKDRTMYSDPRNRQIAYKFHRCWPPGTIFGHHDEKRVNGLEIL